METNHLTAPMDPSTPSLIILLKWGPSGDRYFWNERHKENVSSPHQK